MVLLVCKVANSTLPLKNPNFSLFIIIMKFLHHNSIMYIENNKRQLQLRVVFLCNKIPKI
ncbi:hypothetical protein CN540_29635 [Bacillus toyonensis]|nr:hypothetical protein CN633_31335 [Bacillus toyonensis]PEN45629.1 hypothetical protein CN540_29635 [Bacillus toyonensis]PGE07569.1 hypothetical protein COM54_23835 [Bacillus toyonensis]PGE09313.1 hypothetical protein COM64_30250 [Bacillus toyonensis]